MKKNLKDTPCYKCDFKKFSPCCYARYNDGEKCGAQRLTAYWRKKERNAEQSKRLGELLTVNGIVPKYTIGQEVFLKGWLNTVEKTNIRELVVSKDSKRYWYKVKGHTEYLYEEKNVYPTAAECVESMIADFVQRTRMEAESLKKLAVSSGLPLEDIGGLLD